MLILTRKIGEKIKIGSEITLEVLGIQRNQVRFGIVAPKNVAIYRNELIKPDTNEIKTRGQYDKTI